MDLRSASEYFKRHWRNRTESEAYKQELDRRSSSSSNRNQAGTKSVVDDEPDAHTRTGSRRASEQLRPQNADTAEGRSAAQQQRIIESYLGNMLVVLKQIDAKKTGQKDVGEAIDSALRLLSQTAVEPIELLAFGKQVDALKTRKPEIAQAVEKAVGGLSLRERSYWVLIQSELRQLSDSEAKGERLQFGQNLVSTTVGLFELFLGPVGPLFKTGRELYLEHKDDAAALLKRFTAHSTFVSNRLASFQRMWSRTNTGFVQRYPKLVAALDGFGKRLANMGTSIFDRLGRLRRGRLGRIVGGAAGLLGAGGGAGALLAAAGIGELFSLAGQAKDKIKGTNTYRDAQKGWDSKEQNPDESPLSVNNIFAALSSVTSMITGLFGDLVGLMSNAWNTVTGAVGGAWSRLTNTFSSGWDALKSSTSKFVSDGIILSSTIALYNFITGSNETAPGTGANVPAPAAPAAPAPPTPAITTAAAAAPVAAAPTAAPAAAQGLNDVLGGDGTPNVDNVPPMPAGGDPDKGRRSVRLKSGADLSGMNPGLMANFYAMVGEYNDITGKTVQVNSGHRDPQEQAALYKKDPQKAAPPGYSMHEFGLALDMQSVDANAMVSLGLFDKYGFVRPVRGETWHVEPMAIQSAKASIRKGRGEQDVQIAAAGDQQNADTEGVASTTKATARAAQTAQNTAQTGSASAEQSVQIATAPVPVSTSNASSIAAMTDRASTPTSDTGAVNSMMPASMQLGTQPDDGGSQSLTDSISQEPSLVDSAADMLGVDRVAVQAPPTFERAASETNDMSNDLVVSPDKPSAQSKSRSVVGKVHAEEIGFYIGDLGMLTMNLGAQ